MGLHTMPKIPPLVMPSSTELGSSRRRRLSVSQSAALTLLSLKSGSTSVDTTVESGASAWNDCRNHRTTRQKNSFTFQEEHNDSACSSITHEDEIGDEHTIEELLITNKRKRSEITPIREIHHLTKAALIQPTLLYILRNEKVKSSQSPLKKQMEFASFHLPPGRPLSCPPPLPSRIMRASSRLLASPSYPKLPKTSK